MRSVFVGPRERVLMMAAGNSSTDKRARVEKRFVMFPVKRIVSSGMAAVLALALVVPTALANTVAGRDVREKNVKGTGQYQPVPHQRNYAKRNEGGQEQRPQRLSPEERRQLRRDIKEAGREIYLPRR